MNRETSRNQQEFGLKETNLRVEVQHSLCDGRLRPRAETTPGQDPGRDLGSWDVPGFSREPSTGPCGIKWKESDVCLLKHIRCNGDLKFNGCQGTFFPLGEPEPGSGSESSPENSFALQ